MNVLQLISQIFKPATELIDNLHTSKEEKLEQKAVLLQLQTDFLVEGLQYESERLKQKAEIIKAEATSDSWLARNWRPLSMVTFLVMLVAYWFGLVDPTDRITEELLGKIFTLFQIGMGGYIVGRSAEKFSGSIVNVLKKKEEES